MFVIVLLAIFGHFAVGEADKKVGSTKVCMDYNTIVCTRFKWYRLSYLTVN